MSDTVVELSGWRHRAGERIVLDGEDLGRAYFVEYDHDRGSAEIELVPELVFWDHVAGDLTARPFPGHEAGVLAGQPCWCRGTGTLYDYGPEEGVVAHLCIHCDGLGRRP